MDVSTLPFHHTPPLAHTGLGIEPSALNTLVKHSATELWAQLNNLVLKRYMLTEKQCGGPSYRDLVSSYGIFRHQAPGTHMVYTYSYRHSPTFTKILAKEVTPHLRTHAKLLCETNGPRMQRPTHLLFTTAGENVSQSTDSIDVVS